MSKRQWTIRRKAAVESWIAEVKPRLALADWTIYMDWDGDECTHPVDGSSPTALATMRWLPQSKHAIMCVSRDFIDLSRESQTQTLTHELYHCHSFALHAYANSTFAKAVGDNDLARDVFTEGMLQHVEHLTDALADAAWRSLPLLDLS